MFLSFGLINKKYNIANMEQNPSYKQIKQKPYCCVPACISMVLDRRGIRHGSQEEIGYELGLIVPKEDAHLFTKVRTGRKPIAGYGTQVQKKKYSINNYFQKNKIRLKETYYPVEDITDVEKFIIDNLKKGNDLLVCFDNKALYGDGDFGHVSLIQGINNDIVMLVDPEDARSKDVGLSKLTNAMKAHGRKRSGGFWIISQS
ncbi:Uncharacterised protein [uncultured archaeon]|nr:Uncharacterised protein [uncultured archaeon]